MRLHFIVATTGDVLLFDSRMNKMIGSINSFLIATQRVLRIVKNWPFFNT